MEDVQEFQLSDAEPGSTQAEAAPSQTDKTPNSGDDPKGVAFGKALAAEREKIRKEIESEQAEKYKDYDLHKELSTWAQERTGADALSLKEKIELERLQERAERANVPPEVLKRIDELEAKAARGDELEKQQQQGQWENTYWSGINEFVKDRGVDSKDLNKFMVDNNLYVDPNNLSKSFEIAIKAMKHDELVKQIEDAEKNGMKKLIQAKGSIPNINGNKAQGQVISPAPKTFAEARARAMQRMTSE